MRISAETEIFLKNLKAEKYDNETERFIRGVQKQT